MQFRINTINCRPLKWDTVSQPVSDLFKPQIQPNLLLNCHTSTLSHIQNSQKSPKSSTVNDININLTFIFFNSPTLFGMLPASFFPPFHLDMVFDN